MGISFLYPLEWKTVDPNKLNISSSPTFMAAATDSKTNIYLMVQPVESVVLSAEEQANGDVDYLKSLEGTSIKDYRKIAYSSLDIGRYKAGYLDSEFIFTQTGQTIRNRELFVPTGKTSFILNMTTEKSNWSKYEPIFNEIVKSFKVISQ